MELGVNHHAEVGGGRKSPCRVVPAGNSPLHSLEWRVVIRGCQQRLHPSTFSIFFLKHFVQFFSTRCFNFEIDGMM